MVNRLIDLVVLVAELSEHKGKSLKELDEELAGPRLFAEGNRAGDVLAIFPASVRAFLDAPRSARTGPPRAESVGSDVS